MKTITYLLLLNNMMFRVVTYHGDQNTMSSMTIDETSYCWMEGLVEGLNLSGTGEYSFCREVDAKEMLIPTAWLDYKNKKDSFLYRVSPW